LPTAPYQEEHVVEWLRQWAAEKDGAVSFRRDRAGNVYVEYAHGAKGVRGGVPVVLEAHMDHPGFRVVRQRRSGEIEAEFRGGVKPSHFKGARAKFWVEGKWIGARVVEVKTVRNKRHMKVRLMPARGARVKAGALGMWDLPEAAERRGLFAARVCDDLAGVAAIVCALEELIARRARGHVVALFSRAEEVGFAGALAACEHGWIDKRSPVVGVETSRAMPEAGQGAGPIIRVGDKTGIFSAGLTHFVTQVAGRIADEDAGFKYQRKLMDGGTCESTAFTAYGYDAAGVCLALGNYHNMFDRAFVGRHAPYRAPVSKAGAGIASETIDVGDFGGLVRLLVEVAVGIGEYVPGMGVVRRRLARMHREEQRGMLYARMKDEG
jgi:endoglucanase